ncbi:hypothetical protein Taro_047023 [Colocasia esculenta]|uniref:Uncharacterized protein n=1 Tax=Colocasia esculenta TaxID=4460 RepID=A0A843X686_COLES|nr:hypothetical protein [Colocasia esculenta]
MLRRCCGSRGVHALVLEGGGSSCHLLQHRVYLEVPNSEKIAEALHSKIVYQGPREATLDFFETMGFSCPERKNVADFLDWAFLDRFPEPAHCLGFCGREASHIVIRVSLIVVTENQKRLLTLRLEEPLATLLLSLSPLPVPARSPRSVVAFPSGCVFAVALRCSGLRGHCRTLSLVFGACFLP